MEKNNRRMDVMDGAVFKLIIIGKNRTTSTEASNITIKNYHIKVNLSI